MVDGLTLDDITDSGDVLKALDTGNAWRSVAARQWIVAVIPTWKLLRAEIMVVFLCKFFT